MEGECEDVQVSLESSWTVLKGSLETCVSVVFLDPHTHDPIISSSPHPFTKLVLEPPAEPAPCEITVKFRGRLCHVQSLYTSSTARICEIYSHSTLEADPEYICTVKGWIPCKDNFSTDEGTEVGLVDATTKREDDTDSDCVDGGLVSSVVSPRVASSHLVSDDHEKSVYSSGEDGWVNVKLNGSFSADSACVSLTAPDLDNWHVPLNAEELVHLEDQLAMGSLGDVAEVRGLENHINLSDRPCQGKACKEQIGPGDSLQDMYESEVELVDHNPWAAITIRLLSLQNKSVAEVDQIVFLVVSGPVPEPAASTTQSDGRGATSALFAMFLPSMIQMARGVSSDSKDMKNETPSQVCQEKQDTQDESHAGKEDIIIATHPSELGGDLPVLENSTPSADNDADCAAPKTDRSSKPGELDEISLHERDVDGNALKRTMEPGDQAFHSGIDSNPVCDCKESVGDVIAKELTTTFNAFSERFDRLELMCSRMESFLHKTFETLDERIRRLEVQHNKVFGEADCVSKHLGTSSDPCVMQNQHRSNQVQISSPLLQSPESKEEADSEWSESAVKDHSEMQHVVKEASVAANVVHSSSSNIVNLVEEMPSEVEESNESEVKVVSMGSNDKERLVSLSNAWATALSAFASSFSSVNVETENSATGFLDDLSLDSSCYDASVSILQYSNELEEEGYGSGSCSNFDVKLVMATDVDIKAVNSDNGPAHGEGEEPPCGEQEGQGILLRSDSMASIPAMSFDFLDVREVRSTPDEQIGLRKEPACGEQMSIAEEGPVGTLLSSHAMAFDLLDLGEMRSIPFQKIGAGSEINSCIDNLEGDNIFLPSNSGPPEPNNIFKKMQSATDDLDVGPSDFLTQQDAQSSSPQFDIFSSAQSNSMIFGETLDDWAGLKGLRTVLSPVFVSSSAENQDATQNSLLGEDLQYRCSQERRAPNAHAVWESSPSSGSSHARKSEEGSLHNAFLELDFLNGQIFSEQGEGSCISEVQDIAFSKKPLGFSTAEASSFPDLLDGSSNYHDGRTGGQDSMCFSQDFDSCRDNVCDNRWSSAPNVFYLNDPELTDDEVDVARSLDERSETTDSTEGKLSDTDSTQDLPFWSAQQDARKDEQLTRTVFPGFENLY